MNDNVLKAKQEIVSEIVSKAKASSGVVVVEYRGLSVNEIQELRRALSQNGASMNVYKNSLVERAVDELGVSDFKQVLSGPNAFVFSSEVNAGAKVIAKYAKRYENLVIKGGLFEGKFASSEEVSSIAKLPNREGLISMLLSCLQAPVRQFACTVKAVADAK